MTYAYDSLCINGARVGDRAGGDRRRSNKFGSAKSRGAPVRSLSQGRQVGMLNCNVGPEVGFIVGGRAKLSCRYSPSSPSVPTENYTGEITTVGLDIGATGGGKLSWAVFMPTNGPPHGALTGDYAGVSGQAAVGVGVGGNILVGGSNRSVTLQPFSVEGDTGITFRTWCCGRVLEQASIIARGGLCS
jgi:hypothetical protein